MMFLRLPTAKDPKFVPGKGLTWDVALFRHAKPAPRLGLLSGCLCLTGKPLGVPVQVWRVAECCYTDDLSGDKATDLLLC